MPEPLAPPDPPLVSKSVLLRQFRLDDAQDIARSCESDDIPTFTMMPANMSVADAEQWISQGLVQWPAGVARFAITCPPDDTALGQVGFSLDSGLGRAEAFYWLDEGARGRGLASESLRLVTTWAIESLDVVRVQLLTHPSNISSQSVAQRCGFAREGVLRAWAQIGDEYLDLVMWSRLDSDAQELGAAT